MRQNTYTLWKAEEYHYAMAYGFVPSITSYIHEDETIRPTMIIIPGGGYRVVSATEAEIVAKKFYEMGYQAFVLSYTVNYTGKEPLKMQPMQDLARAIRMIRKNAKMFTTDENCIGICGFSAGSHLCGVVCTQFTKIKDSNPDYAEYSCRPDVAILGYPVITSGEYAHRGTFQMLLGADASEEELHNMSLEYQVTPETTPCFIWQTATDQAVPVENSYLFAQALKKQGVPFAHHVFSYGSHGLSVANDAWAQGEYGEPYTALQLKKIVEAYKNGDERLRDMAQEDVRIAENLAEGRVDRSQMKPNPEVAVWPELADAWVRRILKEV